MRQPCQSLFCEKEPKINCNCHIYSNFTVILPQVSIFMTQMRILFLCKHNCIFGRRTDNGQSNLVFLSHYDIFILPQMGLKIIWYLFYIQVSENSNIYEKEEKDFITKRTLKVIYVQFYTLVQMTLHTNSTYLVHWLKQEPWSFRVISKNRKFIN